jgi:hypothetical protein
MRKVLFAAVALVMLLSLFAGSAVAAEPKRVEQNYIGQLGEVWFHYYGGFFPFERVDAYLYRPSTLAGWPLVDPPVVGTWWWTGDGSQVRRQSWPDWQFADMFGYYFTQFMLPRDEVWFPCSYPLKWKCNYIIDPYTIEWHSPATQPFELGMYWPWLDYDAAANPMDTVSPLEVWLVGETGFGWIIEFEVTGYYWKWTDIND